MFRRRDLSLVLCFGAGILSLVLCFGAGNLSFVLCLSFAKHMDFVFRIANFAEKKTMKTTDDTRATCKVSSRR